MLPLKNKTAWQPINGKGYVIVTGLLTFIDNLGNFIIANTGNNIVTNGSYVTGLNPTSWTEEPAK